MANGADLIAERLSRAGCRHAFGIPGGEVLALVEALGNHGIEFHLAKQESAAGFMAEGTFHATGAPAILLTTLGPGVSSAVNVIANAEQDRIPLICLTGRIDPHEELTYTHQIFDHQAILRPVTKASLTAVSGAVDVVIDRAIALSLANPPGPVHIDVPISVASEQQTATLPANHEPAEASRPAPGPAFDRARTWLTNAERPLMIAGLEVLGTNAADRVARTCVDLDIPLITTYKAKGVLSEDHPLAMGAAGLSPKADRFLLELVDASDLLVLAGYDPIEMRTGWRNPWPKDKPVIDIRSSDQVHYMHSAQVRFVGDVGESLAALTGQIGARPRWPDARPSKTRLSMREAFAGSPGFGPETIIQTARACLPRDTLATVDSGAHRILLSQLWTCFEPRTLLQSTGLCTMGCALPLGIGYAIAEPSRPVAVFVGDAGLEMVLGELATLRDSTRAVMVFVFVDASLALIELKQRNLGLANRGVDFQRSDFAGIAAALGGVGVDVHDENTLRQAIAQALSAESFTVIACHLPRRAYDQKL